MGDARLICDEMVAYTSESFCGKHESCISRQNDDRVGCAYRFSKTNLAYKN